MNSNMVSRILCIVAVLNVVSCATWQSFHPQKPKELAHKKGCYIEEINDVIPFGEDISPIGRCYRIECSRGMLYYASCGVAYTNDPKCHVTEEDVRRPYPDCCPNIECDVDNNI